MMPVTAEARDHVKFGFQFRPSKQEIGTGEIGVDGQFMLQIS
jgi:hypothetical protein